MRGGDSGAATLTRSGHHRSRASQVPILPPAFKDPSQPFVKNGLPLFLMREHPSRFPSLLISLLLLVDSGAAAVHGGTPAIVQALARLETLGSVLMIGAHPDDENTYLLAFYARGRHLRTAYLSATRGEGGQNLIGPERGELLGLIRTQELLAARRIDGAEQFFIRAIDFGYSKSAAETLEKWGREAVLSDMVWVIRRFRPDVIILRFSGTPRDGHGHHQASAMLGKEAFHAAADARRFPEQLRGVQPWRAKRLLWNLFGFSPEQDRAAAQTPGRLEVDAGRFDPVLGQSYAEIAARSRSMHRSQGFGTASRPGPSRHYLAHVAGEPASRDAFDGIDTSWNRLPGGAAVAPLLAEAVRSFQPHHPERTVPLLLRARPLIAAIADERARRKLAELDEAVALCTGLWLNAEADRPIAVPGARIQVRWTALNRSRFPMRLRGLEVEGMGSAANVDHQAALDYNRPASGTVDRAVPGAQPYSQPFWLMRPREGSRYAIERQEWIGPADQPPLLTARFHIVAGSERIELQRPVRYRYVDPAEGERERPLVVAPAAAVNLADHALLFPAAAPRPVSVEVHANVPQAAGDLRAVAAAGWGVQPAARAFRVAEAGQQQALEFSVTPPPADSFAELRASALLGGSAVQAGMRVIAYPHIPAQTVFPEAAARLVRADVRVTARRIGYIVGAGDEMPAALRQLGCEVVLLGAADLEQRDLSGFDALVTGVRAYNVRPDLRANQPRLLQYVRGGGTLVVQYNVLDERLPPLGPYPFRVGRQRVSVEEAPVTLLHPDHPLLRKPNRIIARDFEGWVQERGLYFAAQWDPRYQTVLASHDPGEPPHEGGILFARYGQGVYVFTGYSWFRQLPAGVPGAYRIFANLISAGRNR
jgi:LmbE family N-acetylglucosaminyl deacetylase